MKMNFSNLFYQFNDKTNEALRLEGQLDEIKQEAEQLKKIILNEQRLHGILTTVGIVHDKKLYNKISTDKPCSGHFRLEIKDYIEPVNSFSLDSKLGESNE